MTACWQRQASVIATTVREQLGAALTGVYVHGSTALASVTPVSDLDVLVTAGTDDQDWPALGRRLLAALAPAPAVELSVVTAAAAAYPQAPWPYLLHVNQADSRVVTDAGHGDPDLLMHYLVTRRHGVVITGPPAAEAFGAVPRPVVLDYLQDELAWALAHADERYAVLNACRTLAYQQDDAVLSKIDGGRWALSHGHDLPFVHLALAAQAAGRDLGSTSPPARAFVEQVRSALEGRTGGN